MESRVLFLFLLLFLLQLCDSARDRLWDSVYEARVDVVEDLIEEYLQDPHRIQSGVFPTDVNRVEQENGRTAMFMCGMKDIDRNDFKHRQKTDKSCTYIAKLLHETGADMTHVDNHGVSILSMASLRGLTSLSKYLIQHGGADINQSDNEGYTPLHKATAHGYIDTAIMLVSEGASLAARDNDGRSPLVLLVSLALAEPSFQKQLREFLTAVSIPAAARSTNTRSVQQLDIDTPRDPQGRTPLHYAVLGKDMPVARILIEFGADPSLVDAFGVSALGMVRETDPGRLAEMTNLIREGMVKVVERKHQDWIKSQDNEWNDL